MGQQQKVFISSTSADLREVRRKIRDTISKLGFVVIGAEYMDTTNVDQFATTKKLIDECDYFILIIGERYGAISSSGISYTEMEYDHAVLKGLKILAFIHSDPANETLKISKQDPMRKELEQFKARILSSRVAFAWRSILDLNSQVLSTLLEIGQYHLTTNHVLASLSDPNSLTLDFEIPEGISDEEAKQFVLRSVMLLNEEHKALGGHGLVIDDVTVEQMLKEGITI